MSQKKYAVSVKEAAKQDNILKFISINMQQQQVMVKLPFLQDPVPYLMKKFYGPSNFSQAKAIYLQQCKKLPTEKDGIQVTFQRLQEAGFISKLSGLPADD